MRKILIIIIILSFLYSCHKGMVYALDHREAPYLYYEPDVVCDNSGQIGGYVTFETYMWDYGFPDTIIVKVTKNGKFMGYHEAERRGILEDSLGNSYSPAYVIMGYNGDNWVYDIHGKFIEFNKNVNNNLIKDPYVPCNP